MCKNSYEYFRSVDGNDKAEAPANPVDSMVSRQDYSGVETGAICLLCESKIDDEENGCHHCVAEKIKWVVIRKDAIYLERSKAIAKQTAEKMEKLEAEIKRLKRRWTENYYS